MRPRRQGRRCFASRQVRKNFSAQDSAGISLCRPTPPRRKAGAERHPNRAASTPNRGRRPEGRNCPRPKLDLMPSPSYSRLEETGGPSPIPPRRFAPGRQGRRCEASRAARQNFSDQDSHAFLLAPPPRRGGRPTPPLRTGLLLENRDRRSRAPPPPPAEGATSLLLRRLRGRLLKRTSPHGLWPRAWEILPFQLIVETVYFPLKAWRAES